MHSRKLHFDEGRLYVSDVFDHRFVVFDQRVYDLASRGSTNWA